MSVPTAKVEVVQTTISEGGSVSPMHPEIAEPLDVKLTVPVGAGGPAGPTVAVIVTCWPGWDGLGELVTVVTLAGITTCVTGSEMLCCSVGEPWYIANRVFVPKGNPEELSTAMPELFSDAEPSSSPFTKKSTVPVGSEPFCAVTVAVIVTNSPKYEGFGALVSTVVVGTSGVVFSWNAVPAPGAPPS